MAHSNTQLVNRHEACLYFTWERKAVALRQSSGSKVEHKTMEYLLFCFSVTGIVTEQELMDGGAQRLSGFSSSRTMMHRYKMMHKLWFKIQNV